MYEMTEVVGADGVRQQNPTPSIWLTAAEFGRWATEVAHDSHLLAQRRDLALAQLHR